MALRRVVWLGLAGSVFLAGQHLPGSSPRSYTAGNVLNPGGTPPTPPAGTPLAPYGGYGQVHATGAPGRAGGAWVRGTGSRVSHPPHNRTVIVPLFAGDAFYPVADPAGSQFAQQQTQREEPAVVIENRTYRPEMLNPEVRDYSDAPLRESPPLAVRQSSPPPAIVNQAGGSSDPQPTIYLIALRDKSIIAALGYWVEGDTLNYITRDANRNRISLDRVDVDFSRQLNANRSVEFHLP